MLKIEEALALRDQAFHDGVGGLLGISPCVPDVLKEWIILSITGLDLNLEPSFNVALSNTLFAGHDTLKPIDTEVLTALFLTRIAARLRQVGIGGAIACASTIIALKDGLICAGLRHVYSFAIVPEDLTDIQRALFRLGHIGAFGLLHDLSDVKAIAQIRDTVVTAEKVLRSLIIILV